MVFFALSLQFYAFIWFDVTSFVARQLLSTDVWTCREIYCIIETAVWSYKISTPYFAQFEWHSLVIVGGAHQCNHIIAIAIHGSISNVSCFGIYMSLYFRTDPILFPLAGAQHPEWREEKKFSKKIGKVFRYRRTKLNRIKSKFTINSVCSTAKSYRFGASIFFLTIAKNNI